MPGPFRRPAKLLQDMLCYRVFHLKANEAVDSVPITKRSHQARKKTSREFGHEFGRPASLTRPVACLKGDAEPMHESPTPSAPQC